jgi:hypothetical protein
MKILTLTLGALALSASAQADFGLAQNGKAVTCYGEDNQSISLNAARTTLKYTVEGESQGPKKILRRKSDGDTFVSYTSEEGTLTLSDRGDVFRYNGDSEESPVKCR